MQTVDRLVLAIRSIVFDGKDGSFQTGGQEFRQGVDRLALGSLDLDLGSIDRDLYSGREIDDFIANA